MSSDDRTADAGSESPREQEGAAYPDLDQTDADAGAAPGSTRCERTPPRNPWDEAGPIDLDLELDCDLDDHEDADDADQDDDGEDDDAERGRRAPHSTRPAAGSRCDECPAAPESQPHEGTAVRDRLAEIVEAKRKSRALRSGVLNHLVAAARSARRLLGHAVEEHGIEPGQETLLFALESPGAHSIQMLARRLDVSVPTVSRAARRLEDNGLVRRAPGFDGRYRIVSLSVDGKKTVRLCRPLAQRVDEQLTDSFSDREVERLVAMLEQVRRSARTPLRGSRRFS